MKIKSLFTAIAFLFIFPGYPQQGFVHQQSEEYVVPTDEEVLQKLDQWQDLKFGVLLHWGLYSVPGIVESWSICSEDVDWIPRDSIIAYTDYKKWYWGLKDRFNPTEFDPGQWAAVMEKAGMKYAIFTTKHHDGFNMFDTKETGFSIANGAFKNNPKADVAKFVFEAFRKKDFMVGAYFSKPDWHNQNYWWDYYATPTRNVNYKIERHPQRWENFKKFTYNQLNEITSNYGNIDILWLDGGWVAPPRQDIDMDNIAEMVRRNQPGILIVDRTVKGKHENYQTPERSIPDKQLPFPWESCVTLSNDWGWVPNAPYKSAQKVINMLIEVTAKGGCLLLGVGPTAQGLIEQPAIERLEKVGEWLNINGKGIYNTRPTSNYKNGNVWFTANKDKKTLYAIYALPENEKLPAVIEWEGNTPAKGSKITLLQNNKQVKWISNGTKTTVYLPKNLIQESLVLSFSPVLFHLFAQPVYKNPGASTEDRVTDLLSRMTVKEKVGQLCSPLGWEMYEKNGDNVKVSDDFVKLMNDIQPGTFWATLRADPWTRKTIETGLNPELSVKALNALQKYVVENTRLGIPLFFAEECAHGHMAVGTTVFPTSLAQASTFNKDLIFRMGEAIGLETRVQGAHIGYGPIIDIAREPRWSRMEETFGEDPVLTGMLGSCFVKGLQGENIKDGKHVYSTLKHFVAYGIPLGGHNGQKSLIGWRELFSDHLSPFKMAVDAGAKTIMTAYNSIDGVPCTSNKYLLTDILRNRWKFNGFVFSDLGSVEGIATSHRTVPDIKHAATTALKAGVETDLGGNAYGKNLEQALKENLITTVELDNAVARVLRLKFDMGLFENPYVDSQQVSGLVGNEHHKNIAREVAKQGTVLLKNANNVLPLSKKIKSIAVIGPNADNIYNQLGDYTAPQERENVVTVLDGIKKAVHPSTTVRYVKGCAIRDTTQSNIPEAVNAALRSDVAVLVIGGSSARDFRTEYIETGAAVVSDEKDEVISDMESGEGYDRSSLRLLGDQEKLLEALIKTGKPLIVVYIQGRPLEMNLASEKADALLCAWYPGQEGGDAIADILFGDYNPAGRLPVSVPRSVGQLPVYYSLGRQNNYVEGESSPLYSFGYGLSYTQFEYSDLAITREEGKTVVSCKISNTGNFDGDEVVQLYVRDNISSVSTPPIQLKDFCRVFVKKGESQVISFTLKDDQLSLFNVQMEEVTEPGEFTVMIGAASNDLRLRGSFFVPPLPAKH